MNQSPREETKEEEKLKPKVTPFDDQPEKFYTCQDKLIDSSLVPQSIHPPTSSPEQITDLN